jgi:hypothetical protein
MQKKKKKKIACQTSITTPTRILLRELGFEIITYPSRRTGNKSFTLGWARISIINQVGE